MDISITLTDNTMVIRGVNCTGTIHCYNIHLWRTFNFDKGWYWYQYGDHKKYFDV